MQFNNQTNPKLDALIQSTLYALYRDIWPSLNTGNSKLYRYKMNLFNSSFQQSVLFPTVSFMSCKVQDLQEYCKT